MARPPPTPLRSRLRRTISLRNAPPGMPEPGTSPGCAGGRAFCEAEGLWISVFGQSEVAPTMLPAGCAPIRRPTPDRYLPADRRLSNDIAS